ncbi:hypothetical protein BDC45DRAFT_541297 [Circinella umbellata]|nr:hypothetical protein BDC45DRAFT_541297 [Circinella umbellata]
MFPPVKYDMLTLLKFIAIDGLTPHNLSSDSSMATCLTLPLSFVIQAVESSSFEPKKQLSKLLVLDAYLFDYTINRLLQCTCNKFYTGRNTIIHLFHALNSGSVLIANFLGRALLPGAPVLQSPVPEVIVLLVNKLPLLLPSTILIILLFPNQNRFFLEILDIICCMNNLMVHFACLLCALRDLRLDTVSHFLFSYQYKWYILQHVLQDYTLTNVMQKTVFASIFSLDMPRWDLSHSPLSPIQLIAGAMVGVWCAHWQHIFSSIPFLPANIIDSIHKLLINFRQEETLFIHKPP